MNKLKPKATVKEIYDKAGGIVNTKSLSEMPRNRRQAYNAKSKQSTSGIASNQNKDLVYDLIEQHYGSLKTFVRNVSFDLCVFLPLISSYQIFAVFVLMKTLLTLVFSDLIQHLILCHRHNISKFNADQQKEWYSSCIYWAYACTSKSHL